ncbi:hypothetical protein ANCDUO_10276 [Ancylostoma duodenale]|uniref:Uncharacterized protein n=1 Tax=Ancylostoma duodenale TaxID=51022 RepID=A0A0C2GR91_9BILA|nr:hypothetical protein ANCDUO_10276 [Ancylostoma duodenale]
MTPASPNLGLASQINLAGAASLVICTKQCCINDITNFVQWSVIHNIVKKSNHRVGGLPIVRLTFRGVQSLTALVQRLSLRRIKSPSHLILLNLA